MENFKKEQVIKEIREYQETNDVELLNFLMEKHKKMIFLVLNKYTLNYHEREEIISRAYFSLSKCFKLFKVDSGRVFSTYAMPAIVNSVRMYYRDKRRDEKLEMCSLESAIKSQSSDGPILTVLDTLHTTDICMDTIISKENCNLIRKLFNQCIEKKRIKGFKLIMKLYTEGYKQSDIGKITNFSQSYISRIIRQFKIDFKAELIKHDYFG